MNEREQRAAIVREVRSWIGTPYVHGARLKGVGADCTFFAVAYENAGIIPHVDIAPYSPQAHLHRTAAIYSGTIEKFARLTEDPKPGDCVMYWIGRDFSHGGVIVEPGWPYIVHGDMDARCILLALGDQGRLAEARRRVFYTFVGIAERP